MLTVSAPVVRTVTGLTYQPFEPRVPLTTERAASGGLASRLMVTLSVLLPPPLVAEQVKVVPAVSATAATLEHPVVDEIADSGSVTDQSIDTSPVYHPVASGEPPIVRTIAGGVTSAGSTERAPGIAMSRS